MIKICGLTKPADIQAVNEALPDYIGFVFAQSRRKVSREQAEQLKGQLDKRVKAVGVFVNEEYERIAQLAQDGIIDLIQLHGDEDEAYIKKLKSISAAPVIKAVRVKSTQDILAADELPCEFLLLDAYREGVYGGTGSTFDLSLIPKIRKRYFIAGGLNEKNLMQAIGSCSPYAADVSSGAETDGLKDKQKIIKLVQLIRSDNR